MGDPKVIGRYEIVEELGRGAMGSVFKARDPAVGRIVALKTIHTTALEGAQSEEYRTRFYREARASGVLAHPGIVPVFDVGDDAGVPFLVMEFVEGRNLADVIKKGERYTLDRVSEIVQQIAEALGYAHRQGVIHRDIKPANVMLGDYGETLVVDWGLARLIDKFDAEATATEQPVRLGEESTTATVMGEVVGTPAFMAPEQALGQHDRESPASVPCTARASGVTQRALRRRANPTPAKPRASSQSVAGSATAVEPPGPVDPETDAMTWLPDGVTS